MYLTMHLPLQIISISKSLKHTAIKLVLCSLQIELAQFPVIPKRGGEEHTSAAFIRLAQGVVDAIRLD